MIYKIYTKNAEANIEQFDLSKLRQEWLIYIDCAGGDSYGEKELEKVYCGSTVREQLVDEFSNMIHHVDIRKYADTGEGIAIKLSYTFKNEYAKFDTEKLAELAFDIKYRYCRIGSDVWEKKYGYLADRYEDYEAPYSPTSQNCLEPGFKPYFE